MILLFFNASIYGNFIFYDLLSKKFGLSSSNTFTVIKKKEEWINFHGVELRATQVNILRKVKNNSDFHKKIKNFKTKNSDQLLEGLLSSISTHFQSYDFIKNEVFKLNKLYSKKYFDRYVS